mgnify:CR=1 FL=1
MSLNFYRRVAFGLSPFETEPGDPLNWALNQVSAVPDLLWPGSIPTEKKMRKKLKQLFFWVGPAECAAAGERLERGQKSKIAGSWKKILERSFSSHQLATRKTRDQLKYDELPKEGSALLGHLFR